MKALLKRIFRLNYFFYFFASSVIFLYFPSKYERRVLQSYTSYVYQGADSVLNDKEKLALHIMNRLHKNMLSGFKESVTLDLSYTENLLTSPLMQYGLSKDGGCGGFTLALAQILQKLKYEVRPIQMQVDGSYGGHIVLDVKINGNWVVLDPLYNLSFRNKQNKLATFSEVSQDWEYYKLQTDSTYDQRYKYAGGQYTNWNRIPIVGPFCKKTLAVIKGKEFADRFSFRSLMLNPRTYVFSLSCFITFLLFFLIIYRKFIKNRLQKST